MFGTTYVTTADTTPTPNRSVDVSLNVPAKAMFTSADTSPDALGTIALANGERLDTADEIWPSSPCTAELTGLVSVAPLVRFMDQPGLAGGGLGYCR